MLLILALMGCDTVRGFFGFGKKGTVQEIWFKKMK